LPVDQCDLITLLWRHRLSDELAGHMWIWSSTAVAANGQTGGPRNAREATRTRVSAMATTASYRALRIRQRPTAAERGEHEQESRPRALCDGPRGPMPFSEPVPEAGGRGSSRAAHAGKTGSPGGSPSRKPPSGTDSQIAAYHPVGVCKPWSVLPRPPTVLWN
jgi:hypothetical protein